MTDKFMDDSARAAIRALAGLEQTAIMLETYAPEIFPEINAQGQKHFGRVMMESAAEAIRTAWADAIKGAENSARADQVAEEKRLADALREALGHIEHMAKWIGNVNAVAKGVLPIGYSFESLGEDMPGMRTALASHDAKST